VIYLYEAIIKGFKELKVERSIKEISDWIIINCDHKWTDIGTTMADMVPISFGGNST
jgi:hypothetical protein